MDQVQNLEWLGVSAIGFYLFLAVWVGMRIWARTQEKLAVHDTLRRLIDSDKAVTPEVIEALKRPQPKRTPAEIRASTARYGYWGVFLVALGITLTVWGWNVQSSPRFAWLVIFGVPGLFCLAHSAITRWTRQGE